MSAHDVLLAMLPEHLLLAGILLLIGFEVVSLEVRSVAALAVAVVLAATAAAFWLATTGYAGSPFAGQFSVAPAGSAA